MFVSDLEGAVVMYGCCPVVISSEIHEKFTENKKGVRFLSNSLTVRCFKLRFRMGLNQRPPD